MLIFVISLIIGLVFLLKPSFFRLGKHFVVSNSYILYMRILGIVFIVLSFYVAIMFFTR